MQDILLLLILASLLWVNFRPRDFYIVEKRIVYEDGDGDKYFPNWDIAYAFRPRIIGKLKLYTEWSDRTLWMYKNRNKEPEEWLATREMTVFEDFSAAEKFYQQTLDSKSSELFSCVWVNRGSTKSGVIRNLLYTDGINARAVLITPPSIMLERRRERKGGQNQPEDFFNSPKLA